MKPFAKSSLLILAAGATLTGSIHAQVWSNAAGGFFDEASNWNSGNIPGAGNTASFTNAAHNVTVTLRNNQSLGTIAQSAGSVEFDLKTYTMTLTAGPTFTAQNGSGKTTFKDGKIITSGNIVVGQSGINSREVVFSNINLAPTSDNTTALRIGATADTNQGKVTIKDGSNFTAYSMAIGIGNTSTGNSLTISGSTTVIDTRFIQLGVSSANSTSSGNAFSLTGGTVNVTDASTFGTQYFLVQGSGNSAMLTGGTLNLRTATGAKRGEAYIRAQFGGSIIIDGGTVSADWVRRDLATDNGITFNSGLVETERTTYGTHTLTIGNDGGATATYRLLNAVSDLPATGIHTAGLVDLRTNGILEGNGRIVSSVTASGVINPGLAGNTGRIEITGSLALDDTSSVEMLIAGLTDFDQIAVDETLNFSGTLVITLDGFDVDLNDSFQLFTAGSFTSNFDTFDFSGANLAPGLFWSFNQDTGVLQAIPEPYTVVFLAIGGLAFFARRRFSLV